MKTKSIYVYTHNSNSSDSISPVFFTFVQSAEVINIIYHMYVLVSTIYMTQ